MSAAAVYWESMPWSDWNNAAVYAGFVRERSLYDDLNRELVDQADVGSARRVLDLACGTGATARACLGRLPPEGELVGVDASPAMVEMARAEVGDPRARFLVGAAASVHRVVEGAFDRAVCNAAFWQFPSPGAVLASVARVLTPGARFVFNVPSARLTGEDSPIHPLQAALARAVESRSDAPMDRAGGWLSSERLEELVVDHGFRPVARSQVRDVRSQGELLELMRIPAMIARVAPNLAPAQRTAALAEVTGRIDPEATLEVAWSYFTVERL